MAYNERLEAQILTVVSEWPSVEHKKMFGGACHLVNSHMFCGVHENYLILRLGEEGAQNALTLPHVKPFDITGRPMRGWIMVAAAALDSDRTLSNWLRRARDFALSLPPKKT